MKEFLNDLYNKLQSPLIVLLLVSVVIYFQFFTTPIGLHNDYTFFALLAEVDQTNIDKFIESFSSSIIDLPSFLYSSIIYVTTHFRGFLCAYPEGYHLFLVGRIVQALILDIQTFIICNNLFCLTLFQICSLASIIAGTIIFIKFLSKLNVPKTYLILFSITIITLPSVQLFVVWVTEFGPGALNWLLAALAYSFYDKAFSTQHKKHFNILVSILLYLIAIANYPATAFLVFIFTLARILYTSVSKWKETRNYTIRDLFYFGILTVSYVVIHKCILLLLNIDMNKYNLPQYRLELINSIYQPLTQFYHIFTASIAGVWYLFYEKSWIIILLIIIIFVILKLFFSYNNRKNNLTYGIKQNLYLFEIAAFVILLLLIPNLPVLLARNSAQLVKGYRYIFASCIMVQLLISWLFYLPINSIKQKIFTISYAIYALITIPLACYNIYSIKHLELSDITTYTTAIKEAYNEKESALIYVFDNFCYVNDLNKSAEYIKNKFEFYFPPTQGGFLIAILKHLENEGYSFGKVKWNNERMMGSVRTQSGNIIEFKFEDFGDKDRILFFNDKEPNYIKIGLARNINKKIFFIENNILDLLVIRGEEKDKIFNDSIPLNLFNGNLCSCWEVSTSNFPHELEIESNISIQINNYLLISDYLANRMPSDWTLSASNDRLKWTILDRRYNQTWKESSSKAYYFLNNNKYKYYKFSFSKGNISEVIRISKIILNFSPKLEKTLEYLDIKSF